MPLSLNPTWKQRAIAGAIAGLPGGLAHALTNEIDRRMLNYDADDMLMVTGMFMTDKHMARKIGFGIHLGLAMAFGATYAVVLNPQNPPDALRKGVAAALTENTVLWPLVIPLDTYHPFIQQGRIARFNHPVSLLQANLRHIALGYGLGKAYPIVLQRILRKQ